MTPSTSTTAPELGRRERRKIEVRSRIHAAARELFQQQGFEATTVDEIAARADVAPATFFNHFHNKQALLGLMATEVVETLHSLISGYLGGDDDSSYERLMRFIGVVADEVGAHRRIARDVLLELMRTEATPNGPAPYLARVHESFESLIAAGQMRGEIRTDHSAAFLAEMTVGMLNSAITSWLSDPDYPVERGLTRAAEFAWSSLRIEARLH